MNSNDFTIRGGSWFYVARFCRSAFRYGGQPGVRGDGLGFRVIKRSAKENNRVLRGGSWVSNGRTLRSAYRLASPPHFRARSIGFRVIKTKEGKA